MSFEKEYYLLKTKNEVYDGLKNHRNDNTIWLPKFIVTKSEESKIVLVSPLSINLINGFGRVKIQGEIDNKINRIKFVKSYPYGLIVIGISIMVFMLIAPIYFEEIIIFRIPFLTIMPVIIVLSFLIYRFQQKKLLKRVIKFLRKKRLVE
ncbi:MAG: amino acid transporter [Polaribacter sp.]|jgi:hypothetical protein